jgi:hypothetical protein
LPIDTSVKAQISESWIFLSIKGHNSGIIKEIKIKFKLDLCITISITLFYKCFANGQLKFMNQIYARQAYRNE